MAKKYNSNWNAKLLSINFSQKQWRQDFAAFVRTKLFWAEARVTRAKVVGSKNETIIKQFEVFNRYGQNILVQFKNESEIVQCSNMELISTYCDTRNVKI